MNGILAGVRRLWTLREVSEITGYSVSTIKRALQSGELRSHRSGSRRIVHSELVRWLNYDPLLELNSIEDRPE